MRARYIGFFIFLVLYTSCTTLFEDPKYSDFQMGMTIAEARWVITRGSWRIEDEQSEQNIRSLTFISSLWEKGELSTMLFSNNHLKVWDISVVFLPHMSEQYLWSAEKCEEVFSKITQDVGANFGSPQKEDTDKTGHSSGKKLVWFKHNETVVAYQYVDGKYCGNIDVKFIAGTETDLEDFFKRMEKQDNLKKERGAKTSASGRSK